MNQRLSRILGPLFGITLLVIAIAVLTHIVGGLDLREMQREIRNIPPVRILLAVLLTLGYYITITGYDTLAFHFIKHPLRYRRIALAAFTGYTFSHNVGMSLLSSGSVRYRIHSSFGLTVKESAKVILFCTLSYVVGLLTVLSVVFLWMRVRIPPGFHVPFQSTRVIGFVALGLLIAYWIYMAFAHKGRKIGSVELPKLTPKFVLLQMLLGAADWFLASSVLFVLLPHADPMVFSNFFKVFVLAQSVGFASQIPGGVGVFEAIMLSIKTPHVSKAAILGSLLLYRIIFYVVPLVVATILLATHEVRLGRHRLKGGSTL